MTVSKAGARLARSRGWRPSEAIRASSSALCRVGARESCAFVRWRWCRGVECRPVRRAPWADLRTVRALCWGTWSEQGTAVAKTRLGGSGYGWRCHCEFTDDQHEASAHLQGPLRARRGGSVSDRGRVVRDRARRPGADHWRDDAFPRIALLARARRIQHPPSVQTVARCVGLLPGRGRVTDERVPPVARAHWGGCGRDRLVWFSRRLVPSTPVRRRTWSIIHIRNGRPVRMDGG